MRRITLAALVVLAAVAVPLTAGAAESSPEFVSLDDGQRLATDAAAQEFQADGVTSATADQIQLTVTVATRPEAVDAPGFTMPQLTRFIRVDYNESITRDVRLHLHEDVIPPRPSRDRTPIDAEQPAMDMVVPSDGHQSITLHLQGETHAVYKVSDLQGEIWGVRRGISSVWSNATGIQLPSIGGGEWKHVPEGAFDGSNPTFAIPNTEAITDMTIQYRTESGDWLTVPQCQDEPVCHLERANRTVLFSTTSDAPAVRYKLQKDVLAGVKSAWSDLQSVPGDIMETLGGLLGGN